MNFARDLRLFCPSISISFASVSLIWPSSSSSNRIDNVCPDGIACADRSCSLVSCQADSVYPNGSVCWGIINDRRRHRYFRLLERECRRRHPSCQDGTVCSDRSNLSRIWRSNFLHTRTEVDFRAKQTESDSRSESGDRRKDKYPNWTRANCVRRRRREFTLDSTNHGDHLR